MNASAESEVTKERLNVLRDADAIMIDEIKAAGLYRQTSQAFAVLTRQEFQASDDRQATGRINHQRIASLNGVAFRPVGSDAINLLAKVEVIDERNPLGGGVLTAQTGREARRILTTEAIWSPDARIELGVRYALRHTDATVTHSDSVVQPLASSADYAGAHLDVGLQPWVRLRADGRLLHERMSGAIVLRGRFIGVFQSGSGRCSRFRAKWVSHRSQSNGETRGFLC